MCCRYELDLKVFAEEEARRLEAYVEKFEERVAKDKYVFFVKVSYLLFTTSNYNILKHRNKMNVY